LFVAQDPDIYDRARAVISGDPDDDYGGDWPTSYTLAHDHGLDIDDASEAAALLVLDHWRAIEAVARALRGSPRGLVSGERVAEIVARAGSALC
jgi:hypothetical protein